MLIVLSDAINGDNGKHWRDKEVQVNVRLALTFSLVSVFSFVQPGMTQQTLQGSATATQTRLSRPAEETVIAPPLSGSADGTQPLNGGVEGAPALNGNVGGHFFNGSAQGGKDGSSIDFAKAFPSLAPDKAASPRLHGGSNSDLGIIGEIETVAAPHVITRVFSSSPAQEAGMCVGDVLLTADGREALPRNIIGVPDTPVTIVWSHRGEIRTTVLIRRAAGLVPMDASSKQEYLRQVGGFMKLFGGGW